MSITPQEEGQLLAQAGAGLVPAGVALSATPAYAQTFDRRLASSTVFAPTTAILHLTAIWLPAGKAVNAITFVSGSTAESGGSNLWYALYKQDLTFMAQATSNAGAAALGANTAFRMALTAAQTCPYSGMYYLGFCAVATGMPTLLNVTAATVNATGNIAGMIPIVSATSTGSLTNTAPSPAGTLTAITQSLYAYVD